MTEKKLSNKQILVVDDDEDFREILCDQLKREGAITFQAFSGNEALKFLTSTSVDAVLSDMRMDDGTGYDLLKGINKMALKMPVFIILTGYSDISSQHLIDEGSKAVFTKPYIFKELVASLLKYFQAER